MHYLVTVIEIASKIAVNGNQCGSPPTSAVYIICIVTLEASCMIIVVVVFLKHTMMQWTSNTYWSSVWLVRLCHDPLKIVEDVVHGM